MKDDRRMNAGNLYLPGIFIILSVLKPYTMARSTASILLHQLRGHIGKQIVVKRYGNKTVVTAYPDMSKVKPSKLQKVRRKLFAEAVKHACAINNDPAKKALYKKKMKKGQTVYNYAIKEYLNSMNSRSA